LVQFIRRRHGPDQSLHALVLGLVVPVERADQRWKNIEAKEYAFQNKMDRLQEDPMIGRKNVGGQPYNIVNQRYEDSLDGQRLEYHDKMVKYSREATNPSKACKAMGVDLRVHFKNTYNAAQAIKGMNLKSAQTYLEAVMEKKQCIPFRRYIGGVGRTPQAKVRLINKMFYSQTDMHTQMKHIQKRRRPSPKLELLAFSDL